MRFNNLYEMNMDLVASTAAYVTSIDGFSQKCPIGRYQFVFETVSFLFEDYRDFNDGVDHYHAPAKNATTTIHL